MKIAQSKDNTAFLHSVLLDLSDWSRSNPRMKCNEGRRKSSEFDHEFPTELANGRRRGRGRKDLERFPNSMESNVGRMTWREPNLAAGARA